MREIIVLIGFILAIGIANFDAATGPEQGQQAAAAQGWDQVAQATGPHARHADSAASAAERSRAPS